MGSQKQIVYVQHRHYVWMSTQICLQGCLGCKYARDVSAIARSTSSQEAKWKR
jgi:hypothetical protein